MNRNDNAMKMKLQKSRSLLLEVERIWKGTPHKNYYYPFAEAAWSLLHDCNTRLGLILVEEADRSDGENIVPISKQALEMKRRMQYEWPCGFSIRVRKAFLKAGIDSIEKLTQKTEIDILRLVGIGMTSLNEIKRILMEIGRSLKEQTEESTPAPPPRT